MPVRLEERLRARPTGRRRRRRPRPATRPCARRPKPTRSGSPGCAPTATPFSTAASATVRCIASGSPPWKPQATLAVVMSGMSASSAPSVQLPKLSPQSQLMSSDGLMRPCAARARLVVARRVAGDLDAPRRRRRLAKRDRLHRADLAHHAEVGRDHGADLRVAAGGRVLDAHRDRLDAAGHLDAADRDHVVDDVGRPGAGVAHRGSPAAGASRAAGPTKRKPMRSETGESCHSALKNVLEPRLGEHVVLRAGDDAHRPRAARRARRAASGASCRRRASPPPAGRHVLQAVALAQRPALEAALRTRAHTWRATAEVPAARRCRRRWRGRRARPGRPCRTQRRRRRGRAIAVHDVDRLAVERRRRCRRRRARRASPREAERHPLGQHLQPRAARVARR